MFPRTNFQHLGANFLLMSVCGGMGGKNGNEMTRIHKAVHKGKEVGKDEQERKWYLLSRCLFIPVKECFLCLVALACCKHTCSKQHLRTYWCFLMVLWWEASMDSLQLPLFKRTTFLLPGQRDNLFRFVLGPSTGRSCFPW